MKMVLQIFRGWNSRMEGEEGQFPCDSEGEIRGMNDTVRNAEKNYNEHGVRRESAELAETIKSLERSAELQS